MSEVENVVSAAIPTDASDDEDAKYGFTRPEMNHLSLSGSVDPYNRHLFLYYKDLSSCLPRVEEDPLLPKLLASSIKSRKNDIATQTKVTVCEAGDDTDFENDDVLVFREMIKLKYELQEDNSVLSEDEFTFDLELLKSQIYICLEFWKGEREARYAPEAERWKCRQCQFSSIF